MADTDIVITADDPLMGLADIAERTGVHPQTAYRWRERGTLPEPLLMAGNRPLWRTSTIREWAQDRQSVTWR